jgi:hypothetical protein
MALIQKVFRRGGGRLVRFCKKSISVEESAPSMLEGHEASLLSFAHHE